MFGRIPSRRSFHPFYRRSGQTCRSNWVWNSHTCLGPVPASLPHHNYNAHCYDRLWSPFVLLKESILFHVRQPSFCFDHILHQNHGEIMIKLKGVINVTHWKDLLMLCVARHPWTNNRYANNSYYIIVCIARYTWITQCRYAAVPSRLSSVFD